MLMFAYRIKGVFDCTLAQYDLKRDTEFRFLTGRCVVDTPNGKVYLDSLRGWGDHHNDAGIDISH